MKDESGFTLVETLGSIALLIICIGMAGGLSFQAWRVTDNAQQQTSHYYQQLRIEGLIRETVEEISIPYWERDSNALPIAREAVIYALVNAGYGIIVDIQTLYDSFGRIRGIRCRYFIDGQEYESSGVFASVPLNRGL